MSHPNPQHDYGENEIGTPMKPSERIEEIKKEILEGFLKDADGDIRLVSILVQTNDLNHLATTRYLDEQAPQAKEL